MPASNSIARNLGRYSTTILIGLLAFGCGGGGGVLEPGQPGTDGNPESPAAPPAPPAAPPGAPASAPPAPPAPPAAPPGTSAPPAPSAVVVSTAGSRFNPATVTIQQGGQVTWQIVESRHNVTFGPNKPQGGDVPDTSPGASVTRVFPATGTFDYECTRHSGMTGQIIVQSTAAPAPGAPPPPPGAAPPPPPPPPPTAPPPGPTVIVTTTNNDFTPDDVEFAPGGTVTWQFSGATHNVTFEDEQPAGGSIPNSAPGTSASRTFTAEGDYDYFCSIHDGMKGRIRVR